MVLMWKDLWLDEVLAESHPRAFSYAKLEDISVRNFLGSQNLNETFHLPLSMQAHDELRHIQEITTHVGNQVDEVERDQWFYAWGTDVYTAKSYYKFYFETCQLTKLTNGSGNLPPQRKSKSLDGYFSLIILTQGIC